MRFKFSQFINVEVVDEMPLLGYDLKSISSKKHRGKILKIIAHALDNNLSEHIDVIDGVKIRITINDDLRRFDGELTYKT